MGTRYFAFSFDDGLEQDRRIVELLKKYDLGATFHLNSGLMGIDYEMLRVSFLGFKAVPEGEFKPWMHLFKHVPANRVSAAEAAELYKDYEVSSHTLTHPFLGKLERAEAEYEIREDLNNLRTMFGQPVLGAAYPSGSYNKETLELLRENGVKYARTVKFKKGFAPPKKNELLELPMNCYFIMQDPFKKLEQFLATDTSKGDQFFLMFSHGYEIDFDIERGNWERFEELCRQVADARDKGRLVSTSIGDALTKMGCI